MKRRHGSRNSPGNHWQFRAKQLKLQTISSKRKGARDYIPSLSTAEAFSEAVLTKATFFAEWLSTHAGRT